MADEELSISRSGKRNFAGRDWCPTRRRRTPEDSRNSVRRPGNASLTDGNCRGFRHQGNCAGLPGLDGGAEGIRTSDIRSTSTRARLTAPAPTAGRYSCSAPCYWSTPCSGCGRRLVVQRPTAEPQSRPGASTLPNCPFRARHRHSWRRNCLPVASQDRSEVRHSLSKSH
jgi:hypothetical protein